ncbi:Copper-fist [Geosmithia morbida]|uniref:Copper-fist n=1 Tax=Geosmithia morbida TaxID=1094350 RepID=A0A9P4YVS0_9HYPO|nr:Copper-fist [Geosmithia morbida]KAF4122707.1 Copper-fist [Geosmithia morbida]
MIIDGEKWACEACVRGHRVSNCQHSERPLQHINKKGRPVSQCSHCRAMRKSRSSHIKCDCGEKTSKCTHLQPTVDGHTETCCCNHGGRCSCSAKKDGSGSTASSASSVTGTAGQQQPTLDTVPESDSDGELPRMAMSRPKLAARRRRANTVHSDGPLSLEHGGHHSKSGSGSKHGRSSQKVGPYQLNRVNSANSASSLGAGSDTMAELRGSQQRRVKSEATSPLMTGFHNNVNSSGSSSSNNNNNNNNNDGSNSGSGSGSGGSSSSGAGGVPPLDLSSIDYPSSYMNSSNGNGRNNGGSGGSSFDLFGAGFSPDTDAPLYSAGLSNASVDWSHYDFPGDSFGPSSYSQTGTQSFANFTDFGSNSEHLPHLVNTTSTSGDVSEVEDVMSGADDFAGSFMRQGMLGGGGGGGGGNAPADLSSIDYDSFYKGAADHNPIAGTGMSLVEDDPAFWMPNYNDGIVGESPDGMEQTSQPASFWEL